MSSIKSHKPSLWVLPRSDIEMELVGLQIPGGDLLALRGCLRSFLLLKWSMKYYGLALRQSTAFPAPHVGDCRLLRGQQWDEVEDWTLEKIQAEFSDLRDVE